MVTESKTSLYRQGKVTFERLQPASAAYAGFLHDLQQSAAEDVAILLVGETGTGKTMLAQAVHNASPRRERPFVPFDVSTEEPTVMRGTLFGHARGAYTGADRESEGVFEAADGGTVFLDEVTDLTWELQGALRHACDYHEVRRVGAVQRASVDVRLVCATNVPLAEIDARADRFRKDLFMRLRQAVFEVPPLRSLPEEIPALARRILEERTIGRGRPAIELSHPAIAALLAYPWPGNVRELKNVLRRALVRCTEGVLRPEHLRLGSVAIPVSADRRSMRARTHDWAIQTWLACDRNVKEASGILEIHPQTLRDHVRQWEEEHGANEAAGPESGGVA